MATKPELIGGLEFLIQESKRIGDGLSDAQWALQNHDEGGGWDNRQVLSHVAATGAIVVPFMTALANAPEGADLMAGMDVDALNAQAVTQRADTPVSGLVSEVETAYTAVIDWVRGAPDELLGKRVSLGGHKDIAVSDQLIRMIILHGLGHVYSCYGTAFFAGR